MDQFRSNWDTVIIGAGQAGLATGYFLKKSGVDFIILDKNKRIGDSWRNRWDSLHLFTPSQYDGLPGMPFPALRNTFPGKDQMADYLVSYSKKFNLPVEQGVRVDHISRMNGKYEIESSLGRVTASNVVVATGTNPLPKIPDFATDLAPGIFQIHSSQYINPGSIPEGNVLVVGAGTSGVEIAIELSKTHETFISGEPAFHIPDGVFKYAGRLYWWFACNVLTINTPIGRKAKENVLHHGAPLIRVSAEDLKAAGVRMLQRMTGVHEGLPRFADGSILNLSTVIWSTGFKPDFSWIEMKLNGSAWPETNRGISPEKGLYFIGMPFQFGLTSGLVGGVGRDAEFISRHIRNQ